MLGVQGDFPRPLFFRNSYLQWHDMSTFIYKKALDLTIHFEEISVTCLCFSLCLSGVKGCRRRVVAGHRGLGRGVAQYLTILENYDPAGMFSYITFMGDKHNSNTHVLIEVMKHVHDFCAGNAVKVSCRFVGKE